RTRTPAAAAIGRASSQEADGGALAGDGQDAERQGVPAVDADVALAALAQGNRRARASHHDHVLVEEAADELLGDVHPGEAVALLGDAEAGGLLERERAFPVVAAAVAG